ncbi:MAG: hemolysin family protein, partial [Anaerolineae bacterium]
PRTRMLMADVESTPEELLAQLAESPYTRLPLYEGSRDNIVGVVHLKDLLCLPPLGVADVRDVMRAPPFVPENAMAASVFDRLQRDRDHVAVVLDEFGGTAGMVALEDLVETIFGELRDEFDVEPPPVQIRDDGRAVVLGDTSVTDLNDWLNLFLDSSAADTIGGLALRELGYVPEEGEEVTIDDLTVRVETMDGNAISSVSFAVTPAQAAVWREADA